jgi:O-antigen ligase
MLSGKTLGTPSKTTWSWHRGLLAGLLVLAALSTKALGAAWALFAVVGLWQLSHTFRHPKISPHPSFTSIWVKAVLFGFVVKAVAMMYWQDPWPARHGEIRMLLGALAAYGAYGYWRARSAQRQTLIIWISHALSLTALLGLAWVVWQGRWQVTTHPIPWAGVMAMFCCWLMAVGLDEGYAPALRRCWLAGSALAVLAVLASQSRGAFVVAVWWLGVMGWRTWRSLQHFPHPLGKLRRLSWVMGTVALLCSALSYTPVLERPLHSLQVAAAEAAHALQAPEEGSNSSVGARLYMWQRSLPAIAQAPWLGHGHAGRKQLIRQWAEDAQSEEIRGLDHVHNEYLHQLLDHGVLGLLSQAAIVFGLLWVVRQLRQTGAGTAALALGGILTVYAVGSLSNVNFAHNYYTGGLSLMTGLVIGLLSAPPCAPAPRAPS